MKKKAALLAAFFCTAMLGLSAQADIVGTSMNFRANPSVLGQSIGSVPQGANVTKITSDGEWDYIEYNGVTGWIHSGNLMSAPAASAAQYGTAGSQYYSGGTQSQYGTAGSQYYSGGTQMQYGTAGSQYYSSGTQYMGTPSSGSGYNTATVLYSMNFRLEPSMNGTIVNTVPAGSVVTLLGSDSGWDYINFNGSYGWIAGGRLSIGTSAPTNTQTYTPSYTQTNNYSNNTSSYAASTGGSKVAATMNFRSAPGLTGGVMGVVPIGSSVQYQYSSNGYDYVTFNGTGGWIKSGNLY